MAGFLPTPFLYNASIPCFHGLARVWLYTNPATPRRPRGLKLPQAYLVSIQAGVCQLHAIEDSAGQAGQARMAAHLSEHIRFDNGGKYVGGKAWQT